MIPIQRLGKGVRNPSPQPPPRSGEGEQTSGSPSPLRGGGWGEGFRTPSLSSRTRLSVALTVLLAAPALRADSFDLYTNPVLNKAPSAAGVQELKQLTPSLMLDHDRTLPGINACFLVVKTNENRNCKLLVQPARQKI